MINSLLQLSPLAWAPGGGELILIFAVILLLFGGKKLPELARSLGQAKKEFGKASKEGEEDSKSKSNSGSESQNKS